MQPGEPAKQQANATNSASGAECQYSATASSRESDARRQGDSAFRLLLQLGDEANSACSSTSSALKAWRRAT